MSNTGQSALDVFCTVVTKDAMAKTKEIRKNQMPLFPIRNELLSFRLQLNQPCYFYTCIFGDATGAQQDISAVMPPLSLMSHDHALSSHTEFVFDLTDQAIKIPIASIPVVQAQYLGIVFPTSAKYIILEDGSVDVILDADNNCGLRLVGKVEGYKVGAKRRKKRTNSKDISQRELEHRITDAGASVSLVRAEAKKDLIKPLLAPEYNADEMLHANDDEMTMLVNVACSNPNHNELCSAVGELAALQTSLRALEECHALYQSVDIHVGDDLLYRFPLSTGYYSSAYEDGMFGERPLWIMNVPADTAPSVPATCMAQLGGRICKIDLGVGFDPDFSQLLDAEEWIAGMGHEFADIHFRIDPASISDLDQSIFPNPIDHHMLATLKNDNTMLHIPDLKVILDACYLNRHFVAHRLELMGIDLERTEEQVAPLKNQIAWRRLSTEIIQKPCL